MKNTVLILLLCFGFLGASAQEVYTSSGKPGYRKKPKKKKGYDPEKLIVGGGFTASISGGYANFGISPIVGYRITDHFSAGVGVGYLFAKAPVAQNPNNPSELLYVYENIVYPNLWTRYFVFRNFFVDGIFEYDFISQKYPFDNFGNVHATRISVTNQCLWLGAGIRQPVGGRVSLYAEILRDVIQGKNSPYQTGAFAFDFRFGIAAGF